jgi:hypothetical protein
MGGRSWGQTEAKGIQGAAGFLNGGSRRRPRPDRHDHRRRTAAGQPRRRRRRPGARPGPRHPRRSRFRGGVYALSADVAAPLSQRLDTLTVTTATISVATAVLVPGDLVLAWLRGEALTTTDTASWLLIVYLGVVTMAVAYALLFTGLRDTPSGAVVVATPRGHTSDCRSRWAGIGRV